MLTKNFWKQAGERALKSAAQAAVGTFILDGFNALNADWKLAGGAALGGAILSVLTSIITSSGGEPNDPSAVRKTDQ